MAYHPKTSAIFTVAQTVRDVNYNCSSQHHKSEPYWQLQVCKQTMFIVCQQRTGTHAYPDLGCRWRQSSVPHCSHRDSNGRDRGGNEEEEEEQRLRSTRTELGYSRYTLSGKRYLRKLDLEGRISGRKLPV